MSSLPQSALWVPVDLNAVRELRALSVTARLVYLEILARVQVFTMAVTATGVGLRRGQALASVRSLAAATGCTPSAVQRGLKTLERAQLIACKLATQADTPTGTPTGTIITLVGSASYDPYNSDPIHQPEHQPEPSVDGKRERERPPKPPKGGPDLPGVFHVEQSTDRRLETWDAAFAEVWAAWPKKDAKPVAERRWKRLGRKLLKAKGVTAEQALDTFFNNPRVARCVRATDAEFVPRLSKVLGEEEFTL